MTNAKEYSLGSYFEPGGKTSENVYEMGEQLMRAHHFYAPGAGSGQPLWIYGPETGIWTPRGEDLVRKEVRSALANYYTSHIMNEVVSYLKAGSYQPDIKFGGPKDHLVCLNGVLNTLTGEFTKIYSPGGFHIVRLPITYDPDADCPLFKEFLEQVLPTQTDRDAIAEFIGYCLLKEYVYEIIVLLCGDGANGKSILLSVLKGLLGMENVSSVTPQQLERSRFSSAQLYGKLACIAGDIPSQPLQFTGILKMLTGGDLIHGEHKNRDPFDFMNYAKLIFSANQVPESWDSTRAFYRRFRIIEFPNRFSPDDENYVPRDILLARLLSEEEKSGILNLALKGLQRLREQGHLSGETSLEEKRLDYIRRSDPAHYFFEKYAYHDPTAQPIPKGVLYDIYIKFAHAEGKVPISDSYFAKKVKRLAPYVGESRPQVGDQRITVWTGLGLDYEAYDKDITLCQSRQPRQGCQGYFAILDPKQEQLSSTERDWQNTPDSPDTPDRTPQTRAEWCRAVLGLFDVELAGNGQYRHIDYIQEQFPGHKDEVGHALCDLIEADRLEEVSKDNYRRRVA